MRKLLTLGLSALILVGCATNTEENVKNTTIETKEEQAMNSEFLGNWAGDIEVPQSPLPIEIKLEETTGTFSVPVQGLKNFPFESLSYKGDAVSISINVQGQKMKIEGTLNNGKIVGTFTQSGASFPITLESSETSESETEIVTYETISIPVEGGELKAALQPTENGVPSPVAIIIAGSGPTDKNANSPYLKSDSYKLLAEQLALENIATIRYDKRGIGENIGLVTAVDSMVIEDFAKDVERIVAYAKENEAFTSVHIIGHSEGAFIGTLAAQKQTVDSIILLAGSGRSTDELLIEQLSAQLPPALVNESKEIIEKIKVGVVVTEMSKELQAIFAVPSQKYLASWMKYNPTDELKKLTMPSLVIHGTTDLQASKTDAEKLATAAQGIVYIEGMNHVLKDAPENREQNFATYSNPTLTLNAELVPVIKEFIKGK